MTAATIQGYLAGKWNIDPVHSSVLFTVRHLGVSKVRGRFDVVAGEIVTAENILESAVTATIEAASVNTNQAQRDAHVKSADFLDVETYSTLTFTSTGIREVGGGGYLIDGELTVHGVTKPITLTAELGGVGPGTAPDTTVIGIEATTEISRADFGVGASIPVAVVSDKIKIELGIEAALV